MELGTHLGSRIRPINYYDIGVVGRRTGVTIKPNVKKDADGMDNIEDFWKDGDTDNETKTNEGIASRSDKALQTMYQRSATSGGTHSGIDLYDQDGIEHARRQYPQHRLAGYIDRIADELPEDLLSTPSSRRGRAGLVTRTRDGSNSTDIESSRSRVSEPPFEECPSPPFHSIRRKIDFSQTLSDVELEDDEAYILAAISTTRRVATPSANIYGNRGFRTPDRSPPVGEEMAYADLQYPRTPRGNNRNPSNDYISRSRGMVDSMPNRPEPRVPYRPPNAQRYTSHSAIGNSRATSSGNPRVFDLEEGGIDYETSNDRSDSDDQSSIPPPPETPSSSSHGIAISKTPDYMVNRTLIPVPTRVTSDFDFIDQRNQVDEAVPYEVEEPQDASPAGGVLGSRGSIQLTDHGKVYALEASQEEVGVEDDLATQPIEQKAKSNRSKTKNTANASVTAEVPGRQPRERLPSSPVEDATRTPNLARPRRVVSAAQKSATIEVPKTPLAQVHNGEEAEADTTKLRIILGKGSAAATTHLTLDRKESVNAQAKDKKKAQPLQIEQEEQAEVPEVRKKSKSRAEAVAPVKQRKEREANSLYVVEPVVRKAKQPEAEDESEVRRSRRTKFKPLEFWKNEKLVLGKSDNTPVPLPVVKAVIRAAPVEQHQSVAKRRKIPGDQPSSSKVKSKTKHSVDKKRRRIDASESVNQDDDENSQRGNDSGLFEFDQDSFKDGSPQQCETLDDDGNIVFRAVIEEADSVHFQDAPSGQYKYHRGLEDESISSGIVRIPGGGVKPNQNAFASSVAYYVIQGTIRATIYKNTIVLRQGGRFLVPRGNQYMIENLSRKDSFLFFAQSKTAVLSKDTKNGAKSSKPSLVPDHTTKATSPIFEPEIVGFDRQTRPLKSRTPIKYDSKNSTRRA
ncbi:hypothetical protein BGX26_000218 [Mortierella sp. AD094]|nr:hypothetical protein BGX26_000218 [Mortierella sp. AD094]